jgi:hypothetical protein
VRNPIVLTRFSGVPAVIAVVLFYGVFPPIGNGGVWNSNPMPILRLLSPKVLVLPAF